MVNYYNIETLRIIRGLVNNLIDAKSLHRTAMLASKKAKTLTGNDKLAWEDSARNCRTARDELLGMARYYMKHLKTTQQTTKPNDLIGLPTVKGDNHVSL